MKKKKEDSIVGQLLEMGCGSNAGESKGPGGRLAYVSRLAREGHPQTHQRAKAVRVADVLSALGSSVERGKGYGRPYVRAHNPDHNHHLHASQLSCHIGACPSPQRPIGSWRKQRAVRPLKSRSSSSSSSSSKSPLSLLTFLLVTH